MIKFKCPECGNDCAEEVVTNAVISNKVNGIAEDCEDLDYGECGECFDGIISRYQCASCGYVIPDITTPEQMVEWLKENGTEE